MDPTPVALFLSARCLMRLGAPEKVLDLLGRFDLSELSHEVAAEALSLKVSALAALGRFSEASVIEVDARARCFSSGNVAIEAELLYLSSLSSMVQGDTGAAENCALKILELEHHDVKWVRQVSYRLSLEFWRFRACDFLAGLAHSRGNNADQARWRQQAFVEFDKAGIRDDVLEAGLLANYAESAVSFGLADIGDFVIERAKQITWTASLAGVEFRIFSALAEASSIAGDQLGALRYFRRCSNCAPNAPLRIRASVERARIFLEIGESYSSREELDHAVRLAKSVDWQSFDVNEQRQLIFLAAQVASYSGAEAKRFLDLHDGLRASTKATIFVKSDCVRGQEKFARAIVMRSNGLSDSARSAFLEAFEIWTAAGLSLYAARAAAELDNLVGKCSSKSSLLAKSGDKFESEAWDDVKVVDIGARSRS